MSMVQIFAEDVAFRLEPGQYWAYISWARRLDSWPINDGSSVHLNKSAQNQNNTNL